MKTTNTNYDFQDFSKCDYTLHWSWSNFFRHVAVCNSITQLQSGSQVLEIGAANSPIEEMMRTNFRRFLQFTKTDLNEKYKDTHDIFDIETEGLDRYDKNFFDCVILTEVLEHFDPINATFVLNEIRRVMKPDAILLLTTPTPQKPTEQLVWPSDHSFEYSLKELIALMASHKFKIEKAMPWSTHREDYIEAFVESSIPSPLPPAFTRAVNSLTADPFKSRQIFLELRKEN